MKKLVIRTSLVLLVALVVAALALMLLWRASQFVPEFYRQASQATPEARRSASDSMLQKTAALASDVVRPGEWEAVFSEEEINGWLSVDLPENHPDSIPPGVTNPRIALAPGDLQLACQTRRAGVETVLLVSLDVYLAEPNVIGVRIRRVRAGAIPLPIGGVLDQISQAGRQMGWRIQWQQAEGDPVALIRVHPTIDNGKPVVLEAIELGEREIYLAGSTRPRDPGAGESK